MESTLIHQGNRGLWYGDLYFPLFHGKLYSPITGECLSDSKEASLTELVARHLISVEQRQLELKALPLWQTYVDVCRNLKRPLSYEEFQSCELERWANEGYSKTLLTYPAPIGGEKNEKN